MVVGVGALGGHFGTGGKSIAEVWASIDANSLVGLQSFVEKTLDPNPEDPTLYFDIVLPLLNLPMWLTVAIICGIIALIAFSKHHFGRKRDQAPRYLE